MKRLRTVLALSAVLVLAAGASLAQDKSTGGIKGKVRVRGSGGSAGVSVTVRQKDREVASAVTDAKGDFEVKGLQPGLYGLTFRKPGLSVGTLEYIEVKAGKTKQLDDRVVLTVSEADNALLRGSVFSEGGYSLPNIKVELSRVGADGVARKVEPRVTNESGQFVYRLPPDKATYRVTVRAVGVEPQSKDVEIDGPSIYRIAFTLQRPPK